MLFRVTTLLLVAGLCSSRRLGPAHEAPEDDGLKAPASGILHLKHHHHDEHGRPVSSKEKHEQNDLIAKSYGPAFLRPEWVAIAPNNHEYTIYHEKDEKHRHDHQQSKEDHSVHEHMPHHSDDSEERYRPQPHYEPTKHKDEEKHQIDNSHKEHKIEVHHSDMQDRQKQRNDHHQSPKEHEHPKHHSNAHELYDCGWLHHPDFPKPSHDHNQHNKPHEREQKGKMQHHHDQPSEVIELQRLKHLAKIIKHKEYESKFEHDFEEEPNYVKSLHRAQHHKDHHGDRPGSHNPSLHEPNDQQHQKYYYEPEYHIDHYPKAKPDNHKSKSQRPHNLKHKSFKSEEHKSPANIPEKHHQPPPKEHSYEPAPIKIHNHKLLSMRDHEEQGPTRHRYEQKESSHRENNRDSQYDNADEESPPYLHGWAREYDPAWADLHEVKFLGRYHGSKHRQ